MNTLVLCNLIEHLPGQRETLTRLPTPTPGQAGRDLLALVNVHRTRVEGVAHSPDEILIFGVDCAAHPVGATVDGGLSHLS